MNRTVSTSEPTEESKQMMDREVDASTEIKFDGVKAKRKLQKIQLNIPEQIQAELPLTFNQEISNYQAQLSAKKAEVNSSRSSVKGFPKDQFKDFDFEGQYYCIRGRNNGKAMQDKVKCKLELNGLLVCVVCCDPSV